jgi:3-phytase
MSVRKQELRNAAWFMLLIAAYVLVGTAPLNAQSIPAEITVKARINTGAVSGDADDPAIWIHPTDPAQSLVIGTDKGSNFLYVWDMSGQQLQRISITNEPNNVDVRSGMVVGGEAIAICVVNAQDPSRLVVFKIDPNTRTLINISAGSGIPIPGLKNPYGLCLYRRPSDGAMFAFGTTNGGDQRNIHQYRLMDDGAGKVTGVHMRAFGSTYIGSVMEGLVADDELGYVYAAEEDCCIHKFYADPDLNNNTRLAVFAQNDGIDPDREGLGLYACSDGTGYILLSSQGNKRVKVYRREGDPGNPHSHALVTTIYTPNVGGTDGLDVTNMPAGPNFPYGLLAKHNSKPKNFALIAWEDIAQSYLTICPEGPASCGVNADFFSDVTSSCAGLAVNFTDQSTGNPAPWSWDFGDGGTSMQQHSSHTYNTAGDYTVQLTVTNTCGEDFFPAYSDNAGIGGIDDFTFPERPAFRRAASRRGAAGPPDRGDEIISAAGGILARYNFLIWHSF